MFCLFSFFSTLKILQHSKNKKHSVKVPPKRFCLNASKDFVCRLQVKKVSLKRFHLNGYTHGFHPQTQGFEPHNSDTWKYC